MLAQRAWGLLPVLLALVLLPGCSQHKAPDSLEGVKVDFTIDPTPPKVGPARTTIELHDNEGKPLKGAILKLEGNMNHAGMKPVFADVRETEPGRYEATLELTMGGDWFVLISGKLADGRKLDKKVDVKNVGSE